MIKHRGYAFSLIFLLLFVLLRSLSEYHFYAQEQNQLFQLNLSFIGEYLSQPGGLVALLSGLLVQFFSIPNMGAISVSLLLTSIGFMAWRIVRCIDKESNFFMLASLPAVSLLFMQWNLNYLTQGTIAFLLMEVLLFWVMGIKSTSLRLLYAMALSVALFWFAGPISMLFSISISLNEALRRSPKWYLYLATPLLVWMLSELALRFSLVGESRLIYLPDGYYHFRLLPDAVIYYSWISFLLAIIVVHILRSRKSILGRARWILMVSQLLLLFFVGWRGYDLYGDKRSYQLKMMDYFAGRGDWDRILELCKGKLSNQLYVCYQNMALANKGILAEDAFKYTQLGPTGLMVGWNKSTAVSALLSDVNFTTGNVAAAQEMAFESNISSLGGGNPRMLKRLVQTNLIYGAYPVAEKYIALLEKTLFYDDWASDQRRFLYNDKEIDADPLLGYMRANLLDDNHLVQVDGFDKDMLRISEQNPDNDIAIQYAGVYYLLAKDIDGFKSFIEKYYGTEILPRLPLPYQEAVIIISERDESYWRRFGISDEIVSRFAEYKRLVLAGQNNSGSLPGLMYRSFGDTYWYYYMFR